MDDQVKLSEYDRQILLALLEETRAIRKMMEFIQPSIETIREQQTHVAIREGAR